MNGKQELFISKPVMNAAGFLGFTPDVRRSPWVNRFGAFVTNPISRLPRLTAGSATAIPYGSGFLLHNGHPNPGFERVIREYARKWQSADLPIIPHLLIEETNDLDEMLMRLEDLSGVIAVECSFHPDFTAEQIRQQLTRVRAEIPIILHGSASLIEALLPKMNELPVAAISLASPRAAYFQDTEQLIQARYYGGAIFPLTLYQVVRLRETGIAIIAGGGITSDEDIAALLKAGAMAVQLDAILWD